MSKTNIGLVLHCEKASIEVWKSIENYTDYFISNYGRVKSYKKGTAKFLKQQVNEKGYLKVPLIRDDKRRTSCKVHRLVAQAFIPNSLELPEINHKDEVKTNNHVENLEWCDHKYNVNYGNRTEQASLTYSRPIIQYDKNGNYIAEYRNPYDANRKLGLYSSHIYSCCHGKRKTTGGFMFKFKDVI